MAIRITERPKQIATMDFRSPSSQREYAVFGSDVATDILIAIAAYAPAFDAGIDATSGALITLYRGEVSLKLEGYAVWTATVKYENSKATIDFSVTLGVQSTKIFQALKDVASYNCVDPASAATLAADAALTLAMAAVSTQTAALTAAINTANTDLAAAAAAASVMGVDPTVAADVNTCVAAVTATCIDGTNTNSAIANSLTSLTSMTADVEAGNAAQAATDQAAAVAQSGIALAAFNQSIGDSNASSAAALAAAIAAAGGNAQTFASSAAATTAATAAVAVQTAAAAAYAASAALLADGAAVVASSAADALPGANGVPDFKGAIGVNGDSVDGCDIEVGKVELSITKRWTVGQYGALPASYLATVAQMTDRTVVNDSTYSFNWMGQALIFARGTLRFRGMTSKWTSQNEIEVTYYFAYSRSLVTGDNFRVGSSAVITKLGWEYLWVRYKKTVSANTAVSQPQSAHVCQVYPYDDLTKLQI